MIKSLGRFEVIAFVTGFALMAYELAAARILAPSIGSSTYVWTSVIGVIIAALSLGYACGGVIADKRVRQSDVAWLLLAAAGGVVMTLVFAPGTLELLQGVTDPRLQGFLASLLLFLPASFTLGVISPYLARLRNDSVTRTGRAVASLSACNAIGGIAGTFCVGFVLFGLIGSRETMLVAAALLVAASWLILPRQRAAWRIAYCVWLIGMGIVLLVPSSEKGRITIDTPSSHYQIIEGDMMRLLATGPRGSQSGVFTNGSSELVFDYTRAIADTIDQAPYKHRILILGGGALTLPAHLADRYPDSQVDVVEIDPELVSIAKHYFNYYDRPNVAIYAQDARAFLNTTARRYDVIVADVYSDISIPFSLTTREYTHQLQRLLNTEGVVIANVIGADTPRCGSLLRSIHGSYTSAFGYSHLQPLAQNNLEAIQNIIMTYSARPLDWIQAPSAALTRGDSLTDNFAPVEPLQQRCLEV